MNIKKAFSTHGSVMGVITSSIFGSRRKTTHGSRHRQAQMKFFAKSARKNSFMSFGKTKI